jgi:DNA-directed RNA polymerase specialized sigma24 family protein
MKTPLTELLAKAANVERSALDQVFAALYPRLRAIARARLRTHGAVAHPDTTSLVHESYLRLVDAFKLSIRTAKTSSRMRPRRRETSRSTSRASSGRSDVAVERRPSRSTRRSANRLEPPTLTRRYCR